MWRFHILLSIIIAYASPRVDSQKDNTLDWNIKLNVPGDAGSDYPTLKEIPRTHFTCAGREPGYYADQETNCQVFRICTAGTTYGFQSFLCPNGTLFNQAVFVCDWWMNVNCEKSQEIQNNHNEHFGNLKPGPQLLKDVRKMITHPMRNPISNGFTKNNFLVTQKYKPPSELLYPNGALTSSHKNAFYVPTKESFVENLSNDISFAASTNSPLYSLYRGNQDTQNVQFINTQRAENIQKSKSNVYHTNSLRPTQTNLYIPKTNINQIHNSKENIYGNTQKQQTEFESYKFSSGHSQTFNAKNSNPINVEAQQNLVSTNIPPTIISKTIAFKSIVPGENPGSAKSRITFKTWILKPKNGKLIIKPIHTNKRLIQSASEPSSALTTPYVYDKPKQSFQPSATNDNLNNKLNKNEVTNSDNRSPTTFRPNLPNRIYLDPKDYSTTTPPPRYEITTITSPPNTYIPPSRTEALSRQYLSPLTLQIQNNQNEKRLEALSSQTPQYELLNQKNLNSPWFTVAKQLKVNNNNIVTDTNKMVQNQTFAHYKNSNRLLDNNELKFDDETVSKEELTSEYPVYPTKSSKIVSIPSMYLEPPSKISNDISENKLSNLPYYSEPLNTIERTVSIKITLPEKIAKVLFKNDSSSDDFEVLNTGSSNYLVYANNLATKNGVGPIPIGKLSLAKYSNISNSQDLVFSFLADSLNAAKGYNNIAKQTILTTPTPQLQNYRYNNVEDITSKISQLTSTQFTNNIDSRKNNNHQSSSQQAATEPFINNRLPYQQIQQTPAQHSSRNQYRPVDSRLQNVNGRILRPQQTSNQIYSGQLYQHSVPEVTHEYYNLPNIKNNKHTPKLNLLSQDNNNTQNVPDIEIIPSRQLYFSENLSNQEIQEQTEPNISSFLASSDGITAQVHDSIKGTLPHPQDNDQILTYNKDQSFYIFSRLNNNYENNHIKENAQKQNTQNDKISNIGLQLIPSIGYKLNDENDKQRLLSTFQINEFGSPIGATHSNQEDLSTNIDYSVKHPSNYDGKFRSDKGFISASSFSPNQSQALANKNSKIEDFDATEPNGYPKISPQPKFNT